LARVVEARLGLAQAIDIYETGWMPKAYVKQQVSFLNGGIRHVPDGQLQELRGVAMALDLQGESKI
jgi:hypothetical protein